jgi:hypothetical protein
MRRLITSANDLHKVVYVSRATPEWHVGQAECVANIMATAPENNRKRDVTGALLACDNWYLQILEGRRIDVDAIMERIAADPTHCDIRRIASGPAGERMFSLWSMCAATLSPTDEAIVQVLQTSGKFDGRRLDADAAVKLLLAVGRLQAARSGGQQASNVAA